MATESDVLPSAIMATDVVVEEATVSSVGCSFDVSGEHLIKQELWQCFTCGLCFDRGTCVCYGCALACHEGHEVAIATTARAYCDCGKGGCALATVGGRSHAAGVGTGKLSMDAAAADRKNNN